MIRLSERHPDWVLGFGDEVWWSRFAQPCLHSWTEDQPLRLQELVKEKTDTEAKALACYGLLRRDTNEILLRFVTGRPVSSVTIAFLQWLIERLREEGKKALLLVWDNASWHISKQVRNWLKEHNCQARRTGDVRIVVCQLPTKSPWLNPIEPHWVHGKRAIVEPDRVLSKQEVMQRVSDYYGCNLTEPLAQHPS